MLALFSLVFKHGAILYNEAEVFSLSIGTLRIYDDKGEDDSSKKCEKCLSILLWNFSFN